MRSAGRNDDSRFAARPYAFIEWVTSPEGQKAIAGYKIEGEQLFFPNHGAT